ncbi:MAG: hypothetical protein RR955_00105 [Raoultibacter sp.]
MGRKKQEYDWLDDPFNPRPETKSKGCFLGLILALVIVVVFGVCAAIAIAYFTAIASSV